MPESHQLHQIEYSVKREIGELFASMTMKQFALGLVTIFEPIFLYQYFDQSLYPVLAYFAVIYGGFALLSPLGAKIVSRIGIKHSILWSVPFVILYLLGLRFLPDVSWFLYILPLLNIGYKIFFWPAFHFDFARFSDKKHRGKQLGVLKIINLGTGALAPLLGGIIIVKLGFPMLFVLAVFLLAASVVPLFMSNEVYAPFKFSYKGGLPAIFKKHHLRTHLTIAGWGIDAVVGHVIWPLMMFAVVTDFSTIGGISSAAVFITVVFVYAIGSLTDKVGSRKAVQVGAILTAIGWIFRGIVRTPIQLFAANTYYKLSAQSVSIGFNRELYSRINKADQERMAYVIYREITLNMGRAVGLGVAALGFFLFASYIPATIAAALGILAMLLFR